MATAHRVRALALKKTKLGETDLIVTFLAEDGSQIRAVAKGARKPGSRLGSRIEPPSVVDLLIHPGRSLYTISEAELVTAYAAVRKDFDRSMAVSVIVDFLDKISLEEQPEDRLFGLALATLTVLESASDEAILALVTAFLLKGIAMHGYRPQFSLCVECGKPAELSSRFSIGQGGFVCAACEMGAVNGQYVRLSEDAQNVLTMLMNARMADVVRLEISHDALTGAFGFVRAYACGHIPTRLKALALYAAGVN